MIVTCYIIILSSCSTVSDFMKSMLFSRLELDIGDEIGSTYDPITGRYGRNESTYKPFIHDRIYYNLASVKTEI